MTIREQLVADGLDGVCARNNLSGHHAGQLDQAGGLALAIVGIMLERIACFGVPPNANTARISWRWPSVSDLRRLSKGPEAIMAFPMIIPLMGITNFGAGTPTQALGGANSKQDLPPKACQPLAAAGRIPWRHRS